MGGACAKESLLYFIEVARDAAPPDEKKFSDHLGQCKREVCSGAELYRTLLPIMEVLMPLNSQNLQVRWFVRFCLKQLEHASCNYNQGICDVFLTSMRAMQFVVRYAIETSHGNVSQMMWTFGSNVVTGATNAFSDAGAGGSNTALASLWMSTELGKLCLALQNFVVSIPLTVSTVEAHGEVINLLLSMCSTALYHSSACDKGHVDPLIEVMLESKDLRAFLTALLQWLIDWGEGRLPQTPLVYRYGQQTPFQTLYRVFVGWAKNDSITCGDHVGRHCAQLLSILVSYGKGYKHNVALDYMVSIDGSLDIQFKPLLSACSKLLNVCPSLCILLYVLLHDNPTFIHIIMTVYPDEFMGTFQEVLRLNYRASTGVWPTSSGGNVSSADGNGYEVSIVEEATTPEAVARIVQNMIAFSYPFISFMTGTLVLVCSQDEMINRCMCNTVIRPSFKVGHLVGRCTISSLCIMVVANSVVKALNDRNEALMAVYIPCLANLAPFVHDIDICTAQRMVELLTIILRRLQRLLSPVCPEPNDNLCVMGEVLSDREGADIGSNTTLMLLRQLSVLSEAVDGMLGPGDKRNDSLIYELLYNRLKLEEGLKTLCTTGVCGIEAHGALRKVIHAVEIYDTEITNSACEGSYDSVLAVIRRVAKEKYGPVELSSSTPKDAGVHAAKSDIDRAVSMDAGSIPFLYEESSCSYDFFGPFVWSTLLSDASFPGGVLWATDVSKLQLFPYK